MHLRLSLLFPLMLALLAGCSQADLIQKIASPEEQALARSYIDRVRARDFQAIEKAMDPSIGGPNLRHTLEQMADAMPTAQPISARLVGADRRTQGSTTTLNTTFEYAFPGKWLIANVAIRDRDGQKSIIGLNVYPRTQSLESENRFTLAGKQPLQYSVLLGAIAAIGLTVYTLIVCARTKGMRRKWLWIVFILAGIGKLAVNWTSGEWSLMPLAIQLLSASAAASYSGPWIVSFSIPLGAIVFLGRQRAGRRPPVAG